MYQKRRQKKLLRKKKRIAFLIVLFLFTALTLPLIKPTVSEAYTPQKYIAIIVEEGDSLWKIAERFMNNQMDIRNYIDIIKQHNDLETANIFPGQIIEIPLYAYQ